MMEFSSIITIFRRYFTWPIMQGLYWTKQLHIGFKQTNLWCHNPILGIIKSKFWQNLEILYN